MATPVPTSVVAVTLSQSSDDDLCKRDIRSLMLMLRQIEQDYKWLLYKHNDSIGAGQPYSQLTGENDSLKFNNQKLNDDNQEMRDLCCFLDDDRQRGRKLAREWQKFGRYTATVMRREVTMYQVKLQDLERRQDELIKENNELKQLCIYLDQELSGNSLDRDDGDGSSNTTAASETRLDDVVPQHMTNGPSNVTLRPHHDIGAGQRNVEGLERRIEMSEHNHRNMQPARDPCLTQPPAHQRRTPTPLYENVPVANLTRENHTSLQNHGPHAPDNRAASAAALANAVRVLDVHDRYAAPNAPSNLDNNEKAIVREMCNVVWRKLGATNTHGPTPPGTHDPM